MHTLLPYSLHFISIKYLLAGFIDGVYLIHLNLPSVLQARYSAVISPTSFVQMDWIIAIILVLFTGDGGCMKLLFNRLLSGFVTE